MKIDFVKLILMPNFDNIFLSFQIKMCGMMAVIQMAMCDTVDNVPTANIWDCTLDNMFQMSRNSTVSIFR